MKVILARNVNDALESAIDYLHCEGIERESRNGSVLVSPVPVTTVYSHPWERVLYSPERDANPFFHLYESMWMLAGRSDIEPLLKYVKRMADYSDDGVTQHGAYGYRWRKWFERDQLNVIIARLKKDPTDRRCALQMWDASSDLGRNLKDVPCNMIATVQITHEHLLDLTVFCRSNDIIWGAYGSNAVHFAFLLEYLSRAIGVMMGRYYQVSVNWHGYRTTFDPLDVNRPSRSNPYVRQEVSCLRMGETQQEIDHGIQYLMDIGDGLRPAARGQTPFFHMAGLILVAHDLFKTLPAPERFSAAIACLEEAERASRMSPENEWVRAAKEWIVRRYETWNAKMQHETARS